MSEGILAYVIDPLMATVQRVRLHGGYRAIYKAGNFECFDCCRFAQDNNDGVFVDDEGLLKANPPNNFFMVGDYPEPLCGRGVVMGCDDEGESIAPKTPWEEFARTVVPVMVMRVNGQIGYIPGKITVLDDIIDIYADNKE